MLVILSVAKDLLLHFHGPGRNIVSCQQRQFTLHPYTVSSGTAPRMKLTLCSPSLGCFAVRRAVPANSPARIHTAQVPPTSANGLSPISLTCPSTVNVIGSLA